FVFRNWGVAPASRIALALGVTEDEVRDLARDLGLGEPPPIGDAARGRGFITGIPRGWHLHPHPHTFLLLRWSEAQLAETLREDDFLWIKLGGLKPRCEPLRFEKPDASTVTRHSEIRALIRDALHEKALKDFCPRFSFLKELAAPEAEEANAGKDEDTSSL